MRQQNGPAYLGATLGVLVVPGEDLEGDGHPVGAAVGTEGVPDGAVHGVVGHVQAGQRHEGHGPTAQLRGQLPLGPRHRSRSRGSAEGGKEGGLHL